MLFQLDRVTTYYGKLKVLDNVTLAVAEGEFLALMGPNGAGKSTVLKTMFGLVPHQAGSVLFQGKKIVPLPHRMVEQGVSFVPQGRRVFRDLTVEENLEIGAVTVLDQNLVRSRFEEMFHLFPMLKSKRKNKSGTLSGGQQQALAIARGLMTRPKLLLLDEPSLGLAPKVVSEIFALIRDVHKNQKTTIVVVEHNIKSLLDLVDRGCVLDKGRVVVTDSARAILDSGILEKVFLGNL